jgi:hypothetical protein
MGKIKFHKNIYKLIFISFLLFQTINCNHEKGLWEKSQKTDTVEAYQSYLKKYPIGTHQDDALIRIGFLRKQAVADNIFLNIKNIYQTNWDLLKKPAVIIITLNNENKYFLNREETDFSLLKNKLKEIYLFRKNKAIFFRIFTKSIDYYKIIELIDMLKNVGVEEIIPMITPELEKILRNRFQSRINLDEVKKIMKSSLPIIIPDYVELEPDDPEIFVSVPDKEYEMIDLSRPIVLPKGKKLKLLRTGKIEYPELFPELAGLKDEIIIARIETNSYGMVNDVKILKCHPLLWEVREVIKNAVKKWIYDYFVSNGWPRKVVFVEQIKFSAIY